MYIENELKQIAEKLYNERICMHPLDTHSLMEIYRYLGASDTGSDLMRRLSDVEENYALIKAESEQASENIKAAIYRCEKLIKTLIDDCNKAGLFNGYSFTVDKKQVKETYGLFSDAVENLRIEQKVIAENVETLEETAAQTKACSASFLEIHNETRLALYATALNRDTDNMLSCKAISLQARDSATESNRNATRSLRHIKLGTTALTTINNAISEVTTSILNMMNNNRVTTSRLINILIKTIETLKNIILT